MWIPGTSISASGTGVVLQMPGANDLFVMLQLSAVPAGGAPTLDVYLQTSADEGTTWQDIGHTQFAGLAITRYMKICGRSAGSTSVVASSDGALAGETVVQGPFGDRFRLKWTFAAGGSAGSYTLNVSIIPKL